MSDPASDQPASDRAAEPEYRAPDSVPPAYGVPVPGYSYSPAPAQPVAPTPSLNERVVRGILLALIVIPVGILVWVLLWNAGFIASIVSFGVAFAATWLYRVGSRARVTRGAMWALIGIIAVTVVLSFLAGIFSDFVQASGLSFGDAVSNPKVWEVYWDNVFGNSALWSSYGPKLLLALLFAALGCFRTIMRLARESKS